MKAKRYPNLYRKPGQPNWVFSKYSADRGGEFRISTGIPATDANAGEAYREGMRRFNEWLGSLAIRVYRDPLVRDIAKIVHEGKKAGTHAELKVRTELSNHILPNFGHLRPSQVTAMRLKEYENEERARGRKSLYNTRKYLFEILNLAKSEGLIRELPVWKLSDPAAAPPKFIDAATFRRIRRRVDGAEKLILFILYYQGARPREVCRYRWEMINWRDGTIAIPKAITKTRRARTIPLNSRVLRALSPLRRAEGPIFPMRGAPDKCRAVYDRGWLEATEALGLNFEVYNLRDSWVTRKLNAGANIVDVARYIDSSVKEIERRYAVSMPDVMRVIAG